MYVRGSHEYNGGDDGSQYSEVHDALQGGCRGGIVAPKRVIHNKPRDRYDEGKGLLREWVGVETG